VQLAIQNLLFNGANDWQIDLCETRMVFALASSLD
jgi:hypothetical protein